MAYADKEKLTSLAQGIRDRLLIKDKTEAQALVLSVTYPNCIYWTSDTHNIIVGGQVYGRSNQVSADAPFSYLPADVSSPSADPQFDGNHDTIYIQPIKTGADAGKIKLWWYVNGAWTSTDTLDLVLPTDASDITYDLTNTPDLGSGDVQSAIEALDGKVEDLRDDVFGDEWVDEIFGRKPDWIRTYCYQGNVGGWAYSANSKCYGFKVNTGDTFHFIDPQHNHLHMWNAYTDYQNMSGSGAYSGTRPDLVEEECDPRPSDNKIHNIDDVVTFSSAVKMISVCVLNANEDITHILRKIENLSIADKTGYKIDTWTDDEIITNTALAVGDVVPYWADGARYGSRGVRLDVKEGDKVLLDTYSPALFGLIFTDENRVVKALYDDRRFDGVWTAPVNGYCYIQDVLYRENYHYSSAHGHLAYMAHDARKRVAKGGDWYNEYAPRIFNEFFPYTETFTANGPTRDKDFPIVNNSAALLCYSNRKFQLHMAKLRYADGSPMVSDRRSYIHLRLVGSDTGSIIDDRAYPADMPDGKSTWVYAIVNKTLNAFASAFLRPYIIGLTENTEYSIVWEKIFVHTSSDFGELYKLAQKIINGEVEVDNFYGVKEKEVDFVKNAIGLQSISDLGYNILDHGATLPIDEEGYKYAKEIYERYKDNPPTSITAFKQLFKNDIKLIYAPYIDCSHTPTAWDFNRYSETFEGCHNLVCVPPFDTIPEGAGGGLYSCFDACWSLKRVEGFGDMPIQSIIATFRNCYSLEYIAKLNTHNMTTLSNTSTYGSCYSLERIEELDAYSVNTNQGNIFQQSVGLRYCLIKNIGHNANNFTNYISFQYNTLYGVPNDKHPDARQSLVDSLLTYSYDRVNDPDNLGTAGTTCTITLSANSYAQLTASEIEAITAKGYTLTHP